MTYYVTNDLLYTNDKLKPLYYLSNEFKSDFFTNMFELLKPEIVIQLRQFLNIFEILNTNQLESYIKSIYYIDYGDHNSGHGGHSDHGSDYGGHSDHGSDYGDYGSDYGGHSGHGGHKRINEQINELMSAFDYFLLDNTNCKELITKYELKRAVIIYNSYFIKLRHLMDDRLPKYLTKSVLYTIHNSHMLHYTNCEYLSQDDLQSVDNWHEIFSIDYILRKMHDFPIVKLQSKPFVNSDLILTVLLGSSDFKYIDENINKKTFDFVFNNKHIPYWFIKKYKDQAIRFINSSSYYIVPNADMLKFIIDFNDMINMRNIIIYEFKVPDEFAYKYRHELNANGNSSLWDLSSDFYLLDDIPNSFFEHNVIKSSEEVISKYYSIIYLYDCKYVSDDFIISHIDKLLPASIRDRNVSDEFANKLAVIDSKLIFYLFQNKSITMSFVNKYFDNILPCMSDIVYALPEYIIDKYYDHCKSYIYRFAMLSVDFYNKHIDDIDKYSYIPLEIAIKYNLFHKNVFVNLRYRYAITLNT